MYNSLFRSDEVDKKGISLIGINSSETKTSQPVISMDKNCLSCSQSSANNSER